VVVVVVPVPIVIVEVAAVHADDGVPQLTAFTKAVVVNVDVSPIHKVVSVTETVTVGLFLTVTIVVAVLVHPGPPLDAVTVYVVVAPGVATVDAAVAVLSELVGLH
jgi:hypothetical protein